MNKKTLCNVSIASMPWILALLLLLSVEVRAAPVLDLSEHRGKVVVLDFWASWCVPCRRSFPWLNQMKEKYADQGLVIIGINLDADAVAAQEFLDEIPAGFDIVMDPDGELAREYDVIAMPSSYILDRNGNIAKKHLGFKVKKQEEYEAVLRELLSQENHQDES